MGRDIISEQTCKMISVIETQGTLNALINTKYINLSGTFGE